MRVWKIKIWARIRKLKYLYVIIMGIESKVIICSGRVPLKWVRIGEMDGVVRLDYRVGVRTACELVL